MLSLLVVWCPDSILNLSWGLLRFASLEWKMFLSSRKFWRIQDFHVRCSTCPHHSENGKGFRSSVPGTGQQPNVSIFCCISQCKSKNKLKKSKACAVNRESLLLGSQDWPALYLLSRCWPQRLIHSSLLRRKDAVLSAQPGSWGCTKKYCKVLRDNQRRQKISEVTCSFFWFQQPLVCSTLKRKILIQFI